MTVWLKVGCFGGDLGSNSTIIRVVFTSLSEPILLKIQGGEAIYKQTRRVEPGEWRTYLTESHIWGAREYPGSYLINLNLAKQPSYMILNVVDLHFWMEMDYGSSWKKTKPKLHRILPSSICCFKFNILRSWHSRRYQLSQLQMESSVGKLICTTLLNSLIHF